MQLRQTISCSLWAPWQPLQSPYLPHLTEQGHDVGCTDSNCNYVQSTWVVCTHNNPWWHNMHWISVPPGTNGSLSSTRIYIHWKKSCFKNVCKSSNLIFCMQCKTCGKQYVGETSTTVMKRFQGHFDRIQRKVMNDDIGWHFNQDDHHGKGDLEMFVLDFIYCDSKVSYAKSLRLLFENNWIHKLRSQLPFGLNTMQSVKDYRTSRNWLFYKKGH